MTVAAMLFMTISVFLVTALVSWCYYKVLTGPDRK